MLSWNVFQLKLNKEILKKILFTQISYPDFKVHNIYVYYF